MKYAIKKDGKYFWECTKTTKTGFGTLENARLYYTKEHAEDDVKFFKIEFTEVVEVKMEAIK